ncbi:MAG: carboxypeptidase regulatory-like domain-containing protein [Candidatus Vogelbacteria bacterium]|nr:carboxypeptidase regulatory-like domain-containing protein [Candidatus Vogelbacteria bacterium]
MRIRDGFLLGLIGLVVFSAEAVIVDAATAELQVTIEAVPGDDSGGATPGGGGVPTPPPPAGVAGCTDPVATNYNPQATKDDGSCQYPVVVPNVSNFSAVYQATFRRAALTWLNPDFPDLAAVRLVRQTGSVPGGPADGILIYDGAGQAAFDAAVRPGQIYFYTAFVRDSAGRYSSGAVAVLVVPTESPPELPGEEEPPPVTESPPGGEETAEESPGRETPGGIEPAIDPFQFFPQVFDQDPLVQSLALGDFIFFQPGERQKFFRAGATVPVVSGKDLSVLINYDRLPEALKIIGLTIVDPDDHRRSSSFILRLNENKTAYLANLGVLLKSGVYPIYISVVNFKNQTVKRLSGQLLVAGGGRQTLAARASRGAVRTAEPVLTVVGLGAGFSQALALTGQINSLADLYLFLVHFWSLVLRVLRLKKRSQSWGVVYDAVTKRPLDPAYVVARRGNEDAATAITDLDGRYGFFLPAATYTLVANKTHYRFPSLKLQGKNRDELYEQLYFGEPLATESGEVINRNIPLDPMAFDWNEFAKQQQGFFILHSRRERRRALIYNSLFGFGAGLALYRLLFAPNWLSITVAGFYLGVFLLKYVWRARRPAVAVRRAATGQPVPFAVIRAFVPGVNQQVKSVVADMFGRFFLLTPPGEYYLTVEEKLPDETYKKIYQSPPRKLDRGILLNDLIV